MRVRPKIGLGVVMAAVLLVGADALAGPARANCRGLKYAGRYRCVDSGQVVFGMVMAFGETIHKFAPCDYETYRLGSRKSRLVTVEYCNDSFGNSIVLMSGPVYEVWSGEGGTSADAYGCLRGPIMKDNEKLSRIGSIPGMASVVGGASEPPSLVFRAQTLSAICESSTATASMERASAGE